jgi:hypothetical protein
VKNGSQDRLAAGDLYEALSYLDDAIKVTARYISLAAYATEGFERDLLIGLSMTDHINCQHGALSAWIT